MEKISYEGHVYESVDDRSPFLSKVNGKTSGIIEVKKKKKKK